MCVWREKKEKIKGGVTGQEVQTLVDFLCHKKNPFISIVTRFSTTSKVTWCETGTTTYIQIQMNWNQNSELSIFLFFSNWMNNWMVMSVISRNHHALHQLFISQRKKKRKRTKEENRSSADERNLKWRGSWHDGVYMEMTIKPNTTISFDCRHRSTKKKN